VECAEREALGERERGIDGWPHGRHVGAGERRVVPAGPVDDGRGTLPIGRTGLEGFLCGVLIVIGECWRFFFRANGEICEMVFK
jgi:hypothetical protein